MSRLAAQPSAADVFAIRQALVSYTAGIDSNDYALFRSGFTEDVRMTFAKRIAPLESLEELARFMEAQHRRLDGSAHRLTNIFFREFDGQSATVTSYVHALLVQAGHPDGGSYEVFATYTDEFVRTDDGWRSRRKHAEQFHVRGSSGVLDHAAARAAADQSSPG